MYFRKKRNMIFPKWRGGGGGGGRNFFSKIFFCERGGGGHSYWTVHEFDFHGGGEGIHPPEFLVTFWIPAAMGYPPPEPEPQSTKNRAWNYSKINPTWIQNGRGHSIDDEKEWSVGRHRNSHYALRNWRDAQRDYNRLTLENRHSSRNLPQNSFACFGFRLCWFLMSTRN